MKKYAKTLSSPQHSAYSPLALSRASLVFGLCVLLLLHVDGAVHYPRLLSSDMSGSVWPVLIVSFLCSHAVLTRLLCSCMGFSASVLLLCCCEDHILFFIMKRGLPRTLSACLRVHSCACTVLLRACRRTFSTSSCLKLFKELLGYFRP